MGNIIKVGMADLNVCKAPDGLTTLGLGSCIGLTLYDPVTKIGGMVHYASGQHKSEQQFK